MRIEYTVERSDLESFYRRAAEAEPAGRRLNWYVYGIAFVLLTGVCAWDAESLGSFAVSMVSVVLFFAVWAAISSFLQPRIVRRSIRELVSRESEDRGILGKHSLSLDDTGIVEETSVNKTVTRYEGVHRLEESDELLLVYLSANGAQIIPKRAFSSEREKKEFWDFLKRKVESVQ